MKLIFAVALSFFLSACAIDMTAEQVHFCAKVGTYGEMQCHLND